MEISSRIGALIAAFAGPLLLGTLFVDWYASVPPPGDAPVSGRVRGPGISGWEALAASDVLLAVTAVLALLPLLAEVVRGRPVVPARSVAGVIRPERPRWAAAAVALVSLAAALLVLLRISEPFAGFADPAIPRLAGPYLALAGTLGIAGGAILAGIGDRIFEVVRAAPWFLGAIALAAAALIASLALPWYETAGTVAGDEVSLSGWRAFDVADVLTAVGGLALLAATGLAAILRWRSAFLALALGGWIAAAIVVFAAPHAGGARGLAQTVHYASGYYLALAASGTIVLVGVGAAALGSTDRWPKPSNQTASVPPTA